MRRHWPCFPVCCARELHSGLGMGKGKVGAGRARHAWEPVVGMP